MTPPPKGEGKSRLPFWGRRCPADTLQRRLSRRRGKRPLCEPPYRQPKMGSKGSWCPVGTVQDRPTRQRRPKPLENPIKFKTYSPSRTARVQSISRLPYGRGGGGWVPQSFPARQARQGGGHHIASCPADEKAQLFLCLPLQALFLHELVKILLRAGIFLAVVPTVWCRG